MALIPRTGPHQCIGKAISILEMRLSTAKLITAFDVRFSEQHNPDSFWKGMKDQVTMMPGTMYCCFENRRHGEHVQG